MNLTLTEMATCQSQVSSISKASLLKTGSYEQQEFDRKLIIDDRRKLVAKKISDYLKATDRFQKVIVFCETEEHAGAMANYLRNKNTDLVKEDQRYVVRITANDEVGKNR